jgi:GT2 family glycosyltransferase
MMDPHPSLGAVVLGWNYREDSAECIRTILAAGYPALHVWYVDNGSSDGAPAYLRECFPSITVVELGENRGLVAGYNAGIELAMAAGSEYVCVLNNDVAVEPGAFQALVSAARTRERIGIVAPKVVYYAEPQTIWSAGARWRKFPPGVVQRGMGAHAATAFTRVEPIDYATSCVWMMSSGMVRDIGLFDPTYSFYYSDYEYCRRATLAGWRLVFAADAVIRHKISLSTQKAPRPARWWRNHGEAEARFHRQYVDYPTLVVHTAWIIARSVLQGNAQYVGEYIAGLLAGWRG